MQIDSNINISESLNSLKTDRKVVFATRSMSLDLFELCSGLLESFDYEHHRLVGTEADEYFYNLLSLDADWVINIDEDAFLTNPKRLEDLLDYMEKEDYVCCGMPDGGVFPHRFHNPLVQNAFFNVINISKIRDEFDLLEAKPLTHRKEYEEVFPQELLRTNYAFDNFEPYYPFFFWLLKHKKKMLYLDALEWNRDPISTVLLDHLGKPFLIHTWYSRVFLEHPERFLMTAKFAREVQKRVMLK